MRFLLLIGVSATLVSCASYTPDYLEAISSIQPGMTRQDLYEVIPEENRVVTAYVLESETKGFRYIEDYLIDLKVSFNVTYDLHDAELRKDYQKRVQTFRDSRPWGQFISPDSQNNPKDVILEISDVIRKDFAPTPWFE